MDFDESRKLAAIGPEVAGQASFDRPSWLLRHLMDRHRADKRQSYPILRCCLAPLVLVGTCTLVRIWAGGMLGARMPFLLYHVATIVSALIGGWRSGILALTLSLFAGTYLFVDSENGLFLPDAAQRVQAAVFVGVGILAVAVCELLLKLVTHLWVGSQLLHERENQLQLALQSSQNSLWDWDLTTGRIHRSDGWKRLRGYEPGEVGLERNDWLLFIHDDDLERVTSSFRDHSLGKTPQYREEYRIKTRNGRERWILDQGEAIRDAQGRALRIVGFETDITLIKLAQAAMEEARSQFEGIVTTATDAIISLDEASRITVFNPAAERLLGITADQAIGQDIGKYLPQWSANSVSIEGAPSVVDWRNLEPRAANADALPSTRFTLQSADGRSLLVEASVARVTLSGRPFCTLILRDVTARNRSEILLAREAKTLEKVARGADLSEVLQLVCETVVELTSDSICSVLLVEADGLLRHAAAVGLPKEFIEVVDLGISVGPTSGSCGTAVFRRETVIASDIATDPLWVEHAWLPAAHGLKSCWSEPVFDARGEAIGSFATYSREARSPGPEEYQLIRIAAHLVGIAVESTRSRETIRQSEERQRLALDAGRLGTWWHDLSTDIVHHDARAAAQIGIPFAPIPMRELIQWMHPSDRERVRDQIKVMLDPKISPGNCHFDLRFQWPDGSIRWIAVHTRVYFEGEGESRHPSFVVGANLDITQSKETEEALLENDRRKDEFLAMLAHELRNPLGAISNAVSLLNLEETVNPDQLWCREVIGGQVHHLARLVDDLLDVSRISRGKIKLRKNIADLRELIRRAVESMQLLLDAKQHVLQVSLPDQPLFAEVDTARFLQVLENLLTNAVKYTDQHGKISVAAHVDGDTIEVSVSDTGVGILPENFDRIFGMFTQVDSTLSRSQGGLGIGLTLVQRLIELHGGTVTVNSPGLGAGSTFTLRLPRSQPALNGKADPQPAPSVPKQSRNARKINRLLVVDDVVDNALGLVRLLEREGYDVRFTHDGHTALSMANDFRPDAVLLDIGLPGLDGCGVAATLRTNPDFAKTTLIAISGYGNASDRERTLAAGFNHHMTKPVEFDTLKSLLV